MKNKISLIILFLLPHFLILMLPLNCAYAYLDPGTGSMLIQAVIACIVMVSVSIGIYWNRLKSFFNRLFSRKKKEDHDSDVN